MSGSTTIKKQTVVYKYKQQLYANLGVAKGVRTSHYNGLVKYGRNPEFKNMTLEEYIKENPIYVSKLNFEEIC